MGTNVGEGGVGIVVGGTGDNVEVGPSRTLVRMGTGCGEGATVPGEAQAAINRGRSNAENRKGDGLTNRLSPQIILPFNSRLGGIHRLKVFTLPPLDQTILSGTLDP